MIPRPELSSLARQDLRAIWSYIAEDAQEYADRLTDGILETLELLARFPGMGSIRAIPYPHLRGFPHKPYVILYVQTSFGIEVYRILHEARDIETVTTGDID